MFSGTFRHPTALLPPSFKLRSQTRKKVENFLKILFVYRTFFAPFLRFIPFGVGRTLLCFARVPEPRVLSPAASDSAAMRDNVRDAVHLARVILYHHICCRLDNISRMHNLAELPLIAETRCCIRISSSVPYVVPAICMQGLARSLRGDRRAVLSLPTRPNAAKTPPEGGVCLSQIQSLYIGLIAETLRYLPSSNAFHGTDSSGG